MAETQEGTELITVAEAAKLEQHEQFNREARAAIRQTWWDRFRGWASRWFYVN
jgi:hypothetical protein